MQYSAGPASSGHIILDDRVPFQSQQAMTCWHSKQYRQQTARHRANGRPSRLSTEEHADLTNHIIEVYVANRVWTMPDILRHLDNQYDKMTERNSIRRVFDRSDFKLEQETRDLQHSRFNFLGWGSFQRSWLRSESTIFSVEHRVSRVSMSRPFLHSIWISPHFAFL
jgi:hypothetical protein